MLKKYKFVILSIIVFVVGCSFTLGCESSSLTSGGKSTQLWTADAKVLKIDLKNEQITIELEKESPFFDSNTIILDCSEITEISKDTKLLKEGDRINFSCFHNHPSRLYKINDIY